MSVLGNVAELAILLKLKDEVTGPLKNIDRSLAGLNTRSGTVAGGMTKIGAGLATAAVRVVAAGATIGASLVGVGIAATKAASDYQASMTLLQTQTGASAQEVKDMTANVLELSKSLPQSATELSAGLYHIESAGLRGSKALDILKVAAQGAAVSGADLESVTNALIAANQSGVAGVQDMGTAMGTLNGIVGAGNMRMQDLTDAFGTGILSTAKTFGVSIQSVGAALADMTDQGIPAIDAATRLRMTMSLMAAPTSKAAKGMESIGLAQLDIAKAMRGPDGILGGVQLLADHMKKAGLIDAQGNPNTKGAALLSSMFGGGRSSSAIMTLIGNLDLFQQKQAAVNAGATGFGQAWDTANATVQVKMGELRSSFDALKIQLGQQLLPVAANLLDALSKGLADPAITQGITDFGQALAGMLSPENLAQAGKFVHDIIPRIGDFATTILPPLIEGLKIAGQVTSQVVGLFMSLPQPLQAAIIAGLAVNKLSGGLVGSGLKDVAQGLLSAKSGGGGGGITSMLGVQKVFVTNMPVGGFGGGGGPLGSVESAAGGIAPAVAPMGAAAVAATFGTAAIAGLIGYQITGAIKDAAVSLLPGNKDQKDLVGNAVDITRNTFFPGMDTLTHLDQLPTKIQSLADALTGKAGPKLGQDLNPALSQKLDAISASSRSIAAKAQSTDTAVRASARSQAASAVSAHIAAVAAAANKRASEALFPPLHSQSQQLAAIARQKQTINVNVPVTVNTSVSVRQNYIATQQNARYSTQHGLQAV